MTDEMQHASEADSSDDVRVVYDETLVPLALRGLKKMLLPDQSLFCGTARPGGDGTLVLSGTSRRYTAMVLIGLASQERLGRTVDLPLSTVWDRLASWGEREAPLGDAGLVLWALSVKGDARAERIARSISARAGEVRGAGGGFSSMAMGWLLAGLSEAMRTGAAGPEVEELASCVYERLIENRCEKTGLFSLGRAGFRRNILAARINARLGSFASQAYPIIGLSYYAAAVGRAEPLRIAGRCADVLCGLQGTEGQWWWIYDVRTARPVIRYPVYGVHQDAMGPMALLAAGQADGGDYTSAVSKSLAWLDGHPECPEARMIDAEAGVVRRAIQRDDPARTKRFGLASGERIRMNLAAWFGGSDTRPFATGHLCDECRPYHLGWILLAGAIAAGRGETNE